MKLKLLKINDPDNLEKSEQGFSLIETMIALTTLGVCLAYAMPLFLYAKINNSKSDIRTGALIVSQRIFDNIRSRPMSSMPITDGFNNDNLTSCSFTNTAGAGRINTSNGNQVDLTGCVTATASATVTPNPVLTPSSVATIASNTVPDPEKLLTYAMGRQYLASVTFCQGIAATPASVVGSAIAADPTVCTDKYRKFKVEIRYNGSKVYDLEGNYTEFK
jgi:prepilin-type N-terminal cleavage/methylation domain-containing protein